MLLVIQYSVTSTLKEKKDDNQKIEDIGLSKTWRIHFQTPTCRKVMKMSIYFFFYDTYWEI
jgi:hypothetical protein